MFNHMNHTLIRALGTTVSLDGRQITAIFSDGEQLIDPGSATVIVGNPTLFAASQDLQPKPFRGARVLVNAATYRVLCAEEDAGGGITLELERYGTRS